MTDIKELALRVAKESKLRDILWIDERIETYCDEVVAVTDFAQRFLAAYLAEQDAFVVTQWDPMTEPSGGVWLDGPKIRHFFPYGTKLFTAPPLPEPAPQQLKPQTTIGESADPAQPAAVGAAPLPEDVKWAIRCLDSHARNVGGDDSYERLWGSDACKIADLIERLANRAKNAMRVMPTAIPDGMVLVPRCFLMKLAGSLNSDRATIEGILWPNSGFAQGEA